MRYQQNARSHKSASNERELLPLRNPQTADILPTRGEKGAVCGARWPAPPDRRLPQKKVAIKHQVKEYPLRKRPQLCPARRRGNPQTSVFLPGDGEKGAVCGKSSKGIKDIRDIKGIKDISKKGPGSA